MTEKSLSQLLSEAFDHFEDPAQPVANHLRRAIRIATKRQDYLALLRLLPETFDYTPRTRIDNPAFVDARTNLAALVGPEEAERLSLQIVMRHMRDRAPLDGSTHFHAQSVGQLEAALRQVNETVEHYATVPSDLTPIDKYRIAKEYDEALARVVPIRAALEAVLERVKQAVYDILLDTERQIESGQHRPNVFERGRSYVQASLTRRAPQALPMFEAAEAAIERGTVEDLSHALTSCRRMIKALADALYPASDEAIVGGDGRTRVMDDGAYRNRLLQFAIENIDSSTHKELVREALTGLGNRLSRLDELANKGVHDVVTRTEAETCVMWTYLTAADFLRIADGTSPWLRDRNRSSSG